MQQRVILSGNAAPRVKLFRGNIMAMQPSLALGWSDDLPQGAGLEDRQWTK